MKDIIDFYSQLVIILFFYHIIFIELFAFWTLSWKLFKNIPRKYRMNKNLSNDAYYQALNDAIYAALAPLENIRKDSAIRLLGGIIGKGA